MKSIATVIFVVSCFVTTVRSQTSLGSKSSLATEAQSVYPEVQGLYIDLHEHPELSLHETQTAAKLAAQLRQHGYEVTEKIGGTGIVGILRNGEGPTIMLRTELDGLPVEEKTGLPYASKVTTKDDAGREVHVMQACGHDVHMAAWIGTADVMAKTKNQWRGTLMLVGQPAEERVMGAKAMIADGLFTRFPKPAVGVALHTTNSLPAGMVGVTPEYASSNSDSVVITVFGRGGHGAKPETTIDPIVIAAKLVIGLQTIVSREIKPGDPAVITVGYIQGGTKANIIPDQVELGLTVRSYSDNVRKHLLSAIERVAKAEAESANAPQPPSIRVVESTGAMYNDPKLSEELSHVLQQALGAENVRSLPPNMTSEDYSEFEHAGVPSFYFPAGVASPDKFKEAAARGVDLPSNHSPFFAPDMEPSLKTAVEAEVAVLRALLAGGKQ